ncbi:hypothetical protein KCU77_g5021, partial [Aureobasidium melanogenum]
MPPIRTDKSRTKPDDDNDKKLPSLHNMFISVSRVKPYVGSQWNCQTSLQRCAFSNSSQKHLELSELDYYKLETIIEGDLDVYVGDGSTEEQGKDWCLVWSMFDSGQLGRVYDNGSFQSAVEDHRHTHKRIVQLYVIDSKDAIKEFEA